MTQSMLVSTRTALLSMDLQTGIVAHYTGNDADFLARAADLLSRARLAGMAVIHVQVGFRPNVPELSSRNLLFRSIKENPLHRQFFEGVSGAIHTSVAPKEDDIVITKHRVNAFAGTDLEMILRARDIETLIMFGIVTSGVVLSTLLDAADRDYRVIVVKDCCADLDSEGHAWLTDKLFPRQAIVLKANEVLNAITQKGTAQE